MNKTIFLLLLVCLACRKEAVTDNTPFEKSGQIMFLSQRIANSPEWQMFLMNADGTHQRLITHQTVRCEKPVLSNNHTKIAFTSYDDQYYRLYVVDTGGQNMTLLAQGKQYCGSPAWSPDDKHLVFVKSDDIYGGTYDIYSTAVSGTGAHKLTEGGINSSPQYAQDGNSIFYASSNGATGGIYSMKSDGSGKLRLTPAHLSLGSPRPSPDGTKLAITLYDRGGSQIFVMNTDGTGLKQLTFTVSPRYYDTGFPRDGNCDPVWSPGSSEIAYVSWENGSPDIFVMRADGAKNKQLTNTPMRDESPCWTPDGKYILFSSNRRPDRVTEVFIMHKDGRQQHAVASGNTADIYPEFINN